MQTAKDQLGVEAWSLLLRTHAAVVRRIEAQLVTQRRLPLTWYDVLLELAAAPDQRLRMQELGNRVVLSRTRVSRIVDELAAAGLVTRESDPVDRRGSWAVLTSAGRKAQRETAPVYLRGISEHFSGHLDLATLETLRDALARVLAAQG